jgi:hypothetical protein
MARYRIPEKGEELRNSNVECCEFEANMRKADESGFILA